MIDIDDMKPSIFASKVNKNLEKWLISILTGFFMFIVLYVYKAYNIEQITSYSGHGLLFRAVVHSIATSLLFFISEFYVQPYFKINTDKQYVIWIGGVIFVGINITFLLFNYFWFWTELYWETYVLFYYEYPLVVVIPIIIARLVGNKRKRSNLFDDSHILFTSENGKNNISIKPAHLLYLKSSDNYVEIHHLVNKEMRKHLLRNSLKEIEQKCFSNPYLVRCHRSYMVNPKNIECIVQDSKVTNLNLGYSSIPVSEKYLENFQ